MNETVAEFSRPILAAQVPTGGVEYDISADASECAALARRFGLREVASLTAHIHLKASSGGVIRLSAHFSAQVVQTCVVTLEPLPATVEDGFRMSFSPEVGGEDDAGLDIDLSLDDDPPDPIVDGAIDVGEAVAEYLALSLDPFPRKEGAEFIAPILPDEDDDEPKEPNPFSVLTKLKEK